MFSVSNKLCERNSSCSCIAWSTRSKHQACRKITTYRLTFKKRANVPDLGGTAAGELADGELHQEQRHAAQHQAREIGQQKGA